MKNQAILLAKQRANTNGCVSRTIYNKTNIKGRISERDKSNKGRMSAGRKDTVIFEVKITLCMQQ